MTTGERVIQFVSLVAIGVCAVAVAVPMAADARRRDEAARVLADVQTLRSAAYRFYSDSAYFPAESPDGSIPDVLTPYLPPAFSPAPGWGTLQYRNWRLDVPQPRTSTVAALADSAAHPATDTTEISEDSIIARLRRGDTITLRSATPSPPPAQPVPVTETPADAGPKAPNVIGVTIITRDPRIAAAAAAIAWETPLFTIGNKFTFVIFGT